MNSAEPQHLAKPGYCFSANSPIKTVRYSDSLLVSLSYSCIPTLTIYFATFLITGGSTSQDRPLNLLFESDIMPQAKRRKVAAQSETEEIDAKGQSNGSEAQGIQTADNPHEVEESVNARNGAASADKNKERQERFKVLQARAVSLDPRK